MKNTHEIKFTASATSTRLTEGKVCYQGQLKHNAVLSEKETKRGFADYCGEPESRTTRYIDALGEYIARSVSEGHRLDFGCFAVGLKFRGGLASANAPFDETTHSISVEMTPGKSLRDAVKELKPVNVTDDTKWHISLTWQRQPFEAYDVLAPSGRRELTLCGLHPAIHPSETDEGVWIENDEGERLLDGEIVRSELANTEFTLTGPLPSGLHWIVAQGRYPGEQPLIRVRRRISVAPQVR